MFDSNYEGSEIFGVDVTEAQLMLEQQQLQHRKKYAPAHAGWVGITSYTDQDGVLRVKTETLVASSSITGDS